MTIQQLQKETEKQKDEKELEEDIRFAERADRDAEEEKRN